MKSGKIVGIGTDIIEIDRIRKSLNEHGKKFCDKIFTKNEYDYCLLYKDAAPHFAARFAGKEAVAKALGTGFGKKLSWQDIEILNNKEGSPQVLLSLKAQKTFNSPILLLTLSHCKAYATAFAIHLKS